MCGCFPWPFQYKAAMKIRCKNTDLDEHILIYQTSSWTPSQLSKKLKINFRNLFWLTPQTQRKISISVWSLHFVISLFLKAKMGSEGSRDETPGSLWEKINKTGELSSLHPSIIPIVAWLVTVSTMQGKPSVNIFWVQRRLQARGAVLLAELKRRFWIFLQRAAEEAQWGVCRCCTAF